MDFLVWRNDVCFELVLLYEVFGMEFYYEKGYSLEWLMCS